MLAETVFTRIGSSSEQTRLANIFCMTEARPLGQSHSAQLPYVLSIRTQFQFYIRTETGQRGSPYVGQRGTGSDQGAR
jgi:hypothetical protein